MLEFSTDRARLDIDRIHAWLGRETYWAQGIPRAVLERALEHSICCGAWEDGQQVGFARAITDRATFAYLADVFVQPSARGRGCGDGLVQTLLAHPDLQGLRRIALATRDAHALYARHGFTALARPETFMERYRPDVYRHD
jgi:N-acetylglutamate synthase-like GNAT family acetyltransferase